MNLPKYVQTCMDVLQSNGFSCYAVGGCVRDSILGFVPQDYDLCTDAVPAEMRTLFSGHTLVLAGEKHGTIGVVTEDGVVEITTFRTEGNYTDSRHPGWVKFVDSVEGDLARRDFTINAMAFSSPTGMIDPFGGQHDLKNRILRAVGDANIRFQEDALRILRGVRFSVCYHLTADEVTFSAMLSQAPLLAHIAQERIFEELCKLLPRVTVENLLQYAPILTQVIPELQPSIGFEQHSAYHAYDVFTHTAHVTAATSPDLALRWAALLHDVGKAETFTMDEAGHGHFYGHAEKSAQLADEILLRLKSPTALREEVVFLIAHHMVTLEPERKSLRKHMSKWGADRLEKLLLLQHADFTSKGVRGDDSFFPEIQSLIASLRAEDGCLSLHDLAINGHDLIALGFTGKSIGECLNNLLQQVLEEKIPNEKTALLAAVTRK